MRSYTYRALLAALLVVLAIEAAAQRRRKSAPRVLTKQGHVRGIRVRIRCKCGSTNTIYKFLGIRYAQAPINRLKFRRPRPLANEHRSREYNATYYRPICAQPSSKSEFISKTWPGMSEDCLYLNIYTPSIRGSKKYPVIVFIHGGKYIRGSPVIDANTPGEYLPTLGVVLVTIQYRLGPFGFFTIGRTGSSRAPGNLGLLDQVEALKWIKRNIEGFRGNKRSVTLLGESAGGSSVALHYLSPLSKGLFHRGIAVSGVDLEVGPLVFKPRKTVKRASENLLRETECYKGRDEIKQLRCLRKVEWATILLHTGTDLELMSPIVDKYFLPEHPRVLRRNGQFSKLPLIAGFTSQDGSQFVQHVLDQIRGENPRFHVNSLRDFKKFINTALIKQLQVNFPEMRDLISNASEIIYLPQKNSQLPDILTRITNEQYMTALVKVFTDFAIIAPTHAALTFHSNHSGPAYMFEFAHASTLKTGDPYWLGVSHGSTKPCEFGKPLLKPRDYKKSDKIVSDIMVTMFTNFAKSGNPTPYPVHGVQWQRFDYFNKTRLMIQRHPVMTSDLNSPQIEFWNEEVTKWFEDFALGNVTITTSPKKLDSTEDTIA